MSLLDDFEGESTCAVAQIAPSGEILYGSNRGHDSIVTYAVDQADGRLTCIGHESTRGKTPRHFAVDPAGQFLLAANQDSHNVVVFKLDPASGQPIATGHSIDVPTPACVRIM
jgi:6-phosphogluconolactonase